MYCYNVHPYNAPNLTYKVCEIAVQHDSHLKSINGAWKMIEHLLLIVAPWTIVEYLAFALAGIFAWALLKRMDTRCPKCGHKRSCHDQYEAHCYHKTWTYEERPYYDDDESDGFLRATVQFCRCTLLREEIDVNIAAGKVPPKT